MFQFRRFPTYTYLIQCTLHGYCPCGLPHSEICGSRDICSSPQLIAACHVLRRLLMPRHSPCALYSLTNRKQHSLFSLWIMQASQILSWNCNRYPSIRCSTIKITSCSVLSQAQTSLLPYLSLSYHIVQFSRCSFQLWSQIETFNPLNASIQFQFGGDYRDRTGDLLLARQALSQLS